MKKMIFALVAAFVVAGLNFTPMPAHAEVSVVPQGDGAGNPNKDTVGGQNVQEVYGRGISWQLPVSYSSASATSGAPLSITQNAKYSSTYKGPWFVKVYNTGINTVVATPLTFSAAYTSDLTAIGDQIALNSGAVNGTWMSPPLSPLDYVHLRGLSATATGKYQLGSYNR